MRFPARRLKHGNARVTVDGLVFDSKREAARWQQLQLLERAGEIRNLERQVPYPCVVNDWKICVYRADFRYEEREPALVTGWRAVTEDSKSPHLRKDRVYRIKFKLVQALHGIQIRET